MTEQREDHQGATMPTDPIARREVWFGMWGGPVAAIVAFMGGLMSSRACHTGAFAARVGLAALAILVALAAAAVSAKSLRAVRHVPPAFGGKQGRDRFIARLGIVGAGLSALLALWLLVMLLVLDRCGRS